MPSAEKSKDVEGRLVPDKEVAPGNMLQGLKESTPVVAEHTAHEIIAGADEKNPAGHKSHFRASSPYVPGSHATQLSPTSARRYPLPWSHTSTAPASQNDFSELPGGEFGRVGNSSLHFLQVVSEDAPFTLRGKRREQHDQFGTKKRIDRVFGWKYNAIRLLFSYLLNTCLMDKKHNRLVMLKLPRTTMYPQGILTAPKFQNLNNTFLLGTKSKFRFQQPLYWSRMFQWGTQIDRAYFPKKGCTSQRHNLGMYQWIFDQTCSCIFQRDIGIQ